MRVTIAFQHTAARRRLGRRFCFAAIRHGFNTQPPEGGWGAESNGFRGCSSFNTQPPEGGWEEIAQYLTGELVSTHSRPKAAGPLRAAPLHPSPVSTHSRPKAAGRPLLRWLSETNLFQHTAARRRLAFKCRHRRTVPSVSTHSRPKAAGKDLKEFKAFVKVSTHSRPKAAGSASRKQALSCALFQHTAARRRLEKRVFRRVKTAGFNTQPPEGGWLI